MDTIGSASLSAHDKSTIHPEENLVAVKVSSLKLSDVLCVREVVCKVRDNVCNKIGSESSKSLGKSVDRLLNDFLSRETHTAEGDLVGGLVKDGWDCVY